jgi:signal transduction histidine kinase
MMADDWIARDVAAIARIPAVPSILDVICRTTGMGFAAVARVTEDRWVACSVKDDIAFGLAPGGELKIETTICNEIREHREPVIINDVDKSSFLTHPTPALYGFKSYISMPIVLPDGRFFGTLCAIDPRPAQLENPEIVAMFKLFAELIAFHLDAIDRVAVSEASLSNEREMSALREQFIAVLGHDLRNPLAAIDAGIQTLGRDSLSPRGLSVIDLTKGAVRRMSKLIDDVLDFARTRMGDGIIVQRKPVVIGQVVQHVAAELRAAFPDKIITEEFLPMEKLLCDPARLAQLFSNLMANAITHGSPESPVHVRAVTIDDSFEFSVENAGDPISPEAMDRLFAPFARGDIRSNQQGLGLGLYIASEVASAHGGAITVTSTDAATRFTFRMPAGEGVEL